MENSRENDKANLVFKISPTKNAQCFRCFTNIVDDNFQLIFDETGQEMNIKELLLKCFNIKVEYDMRKFQAICDDCLNLLIETFDIMEHIATKSQGISEENSKQNEVATNQKDENQYILEDDNDDNSSVYEDVLSNFTTILNSDNEQNLHVKEDALKMVTRQNEYVELDYLDEVEVDDLTELKDYMMNSIFSNFKEITFPDPIICQFCEDNLYKHEDILKHCKLKHKTDDSLQYRCVLSSDCESVKTLIDLSYHFVFNHYDLETLIVYSQCEFCSKGYRNVLEFNKHSCNYKTQDRSTIDCEECGKQFRSNKRYRFHLQNHSEKHRPKGCLICQKMYSDDDEFFEHVMYDHEPTDSLICRVCDKFFVSKETFEDHKKTHQIDRKFACKSCPKTYTHANQLADHTNSQHIHSKVFECEECNKIFYRRNILHKHMKTHSKIFKTTTFSCSECGFCDENQESIEKHIIESHDVNEITITSSICYSLFCCEYCEKSFDSIDNLNVHREIHKDKIFHCLFCKLTTDNFKKITFHRQSHTSIKKNSGADGLKKDKMARFYVCDFDNCTNNYDNWSTLVSHKRNSHIIKRKGQKCDDCNETFPNRKFLHQHFRSKHKEEPTFSCPFCPKFYSTPMAISVHVARMHNNNKLACDICGALCKDQKALDQHVVNTHDVLMCTICSKVLKNMKNLKVHIKMVHKKEKRFFCKYCNRGYYNKCDLITHETAIHTKSKLYACDQCTYTTPYKESIRVHLEKHTKNIQRKTYECSVCQENFTRQYALANHEKLHHTLEKKRKSKTERNCKPKTELKSHETTEINNVIESDVVEILDYIDDDGLSEFIDEEASIDIEDNNIDVDIQYIASDLNNVINNDEEEDVDSTIEIGDNIELDDEEKIMLSNQNNYIMPVDYEIIDE